MRNTPFNIVYYFWWNGIENRKVLFLGLNIILWHTRGCSYKKSKRGRYTAVKYYYKTMSYHSLSVFWYFNLGSQSMIWASLRLLYRITVWYLLNVFLIIEFKIFSEKSRDPDYNTIVFGYFFEIDGHIFSVDFTLI